MKYDETLVQYSVSRTFEDIPDIRWRETAIIAQTAHSQVLYSKDGYIGFLLYSNHKIVKNISDQFKNIVFCDPKL